MRKFLQLFLLFCVVTAGAAPVVTGTTTLQDDTDRTAENGTTITILSYNDIQTAAAKENGSMTRLVTAINERRAAHENPTVVVGGGDQVSPHALSPISKWRTPVDVLNLIDPAADVIGNHDLDYGFDAVSNFADNSSYPWLAANIVDEGTGDPIPGTKPYHIVEKQGVRVGIIGLADEAVKTKTAVDFNKQGYTVTDYVNTGRKYAKELKNDKNVDVVIVAGHFRIPPAENLATNSEHVDVIVVGDDERKYPPEETSGTIITEAESRAEYLSEINLTVTKSGAVADWNGRLVTVDENVSVNQSANDIIATARGKALDRVIGTSTTTLDARSASNYHEETALGNMVTDSFRRISGADVALTNSGGIRSGTRYEAGDVTAGDVYSILPFGNTVMTIELSGEELEQVLESQIVTLESETGREYGMEQKLQVSGVSYAWVGHENVPEDQRIQDVWINGEPLQPDETYTVSINSYMRGWDGSPLAKAPLVSDSKTLYGTALVNYIKEQSTVSPEVEDRIRRVDRTVDGATVTLDGKGTTTVDFPKPTSATSVDTDSFYSLAGTGTRINATDVTVTEDNVTVSFADSSLEQLAESGREVQVRGEYTDSQYDHTYFNTSVMTGDLRLLEANGTEQETMNNEGTDSSDSGSLPGFTAALALVALLGAALLANRRQ
jgi:PGF-CTERM protein